MGFLGTQLWGSTAGPFEYGFWIVDTIGEDVKPHGHLEAHVMWAMNGHYITGALGGESEGSDLIIYNPPGTHHADKFSTLGALFFSVGIDAEADLGEVALPECPTQTRKEPVRSILRHLLKVSVHRESKQDITSECLGYELLGVLSENSESEGRKPDWLVRVCEQLEEEPTITVSEIAKEAGVHPTHLIRTFRKQMRCTPGEYIRGRRLMSAVRHLSQETMSISEVALSAGFSDQPHFTTQFRKAFGVTPAVYRNKAFNCMKRNAG